VTDLVEGLLGLVLQVGVELQLGAVQQAVQALTEPRLQLVEPSRQKK
jgi:hypothetical protein